MTIPIALVTDTNTPDLSANDQLLLAPLQEHGFAPHIVPWEQEEIEWHRFDTIIIRSTWNYYLHLRQYRQWLSRLEAAHLAVWNPIPAVRWNLHKTYLRELAARDIAVVPTTWLGQGTAVDLVQLLTHHQWPRAVIKPVVGAGASGVFMVSAHEAAAAQPRVHDLLSRSELMVQPFMSQVQEEGEYSFVFLGGRYSHCVLKRPQATDFRVQPDYGGMAMAIEPPEALIRQARKVYEVLPQPLLYARIDGLDNRGQFLVMEVEINEPTLLLRFDRQAPLRFVQALKNLRRERL